MVAQSCLTLWDPWTIQPMELSRPEYWSGQPFPSPRNLPFPGIEPRSPALQADSLPDEPQGKFKNIGVNSLSLSSASLWPRNLTRVSCIAGRFFTNWAISKFQHNCNGFSSSWVKVSGWVHKIFLKIYENNTRN